MLFTTVFGYLSLIQEEAAIHIIFSCLFGRYMASIHFKETRIFDQQMSKTIIKNCFSLAINF